MSLSAPIGGAPRLMIVFWSFLAAAAVLSSPSESLTYSTPANLQTLPGPDSTSHAPFHQNANKPAHRRDPLLLDPILPDGIGS
jgi:hypothetical protein